MFRGVWGYIGAGRGWVFPPVQLLNYLISVRSQRIFYAVAEMPPQPREESTGLALGTESWQEGPGKSWQEGPGKSSRAPADPSQRRSAAVPRSLAPGAPSQTPAVPSAPFAVCPSPPSHSFSCCLTCISPCNLSQLPSVSSSGDLQEEKKKKKNKNLLFFCPSEGSY